MDPLVSVIGSVAGGVVFFGGLAVLVWLDHRAKYQRRQMEHIERMKALELGRPFEDAAVARNKAIGGIGMTVPIASMSGAILGSCIALTFDEPLWRFAAFAVNWVSCGAVCVGVLPILVRHLKVPPTVEDRTESGDPEER